MAGSSDLRFRLKTGSVLAALISAQDPVLFTGAIFTVVFHVSPLAINGRERFPSGWLNIDLNMTSLCGDGVWQDEMNV